MKFYKISTILKNKAKKSTINKRINNNLYKDYLTRKNRKDNMRLNHFYNESQLYPFSPLINSSGYLTFSPNNSSNFTPYTTRHNFYRRNIPNQNYSFFNEKLPFERNELTENNVYGNPNKFNNLLYDEFYNNGIQNHPYIYNVKNIKDKNNMNRTSYRFFTPHKYKNNNRINSQISEYLNNFRKNNKRMNNFDYMNNSNYNGNNGLYQKKRNNSNIDKNRGIFFFFFNRNETPYNSNFKKINEINKYFNNNKYNPRLNNIKTQNKNKVSKNKNIKYNNHKSNNKNDEEENNSKRLYNDQKDYYYSFNKDNKIKDPSKKNSNNSLNPSSLGVDHMRTFYTYKPILSNTGNAFNSNVNSASDRMLDTHYHFLNGLKMASGEVNQCFYDFNNGNKNNKNDDAQSLQSLSDSKMLELANMYLKDEDNSVENYQMNNIIYNKKKKNVK